MFNLVSIFRCCTVIQPPPDLTCSSSQLTLPAFVCQAKKTQEKEAASKPQKAEAKPNEWCQATPPAGGKRERRVQQRSRKQHAVPDGKPPEGSSTKMQEQTKWASKFDCQNPVSFHLNIEHVLFAAWTPKVWGQWKLYTNFKYNRYIYKNCACHMCGNYCSEIISMALSFTHNGLICLWFFLFFLTEISVYLKDPKSCMKVLNENLLLSWKGRNKIVMTAVYF